MNRVIDFLRKKFAIGSKKTMKTLRMEVFMNNVVTSHAFAKLTIQEKLLSLGRLIELFQNDFGFTPKSMDNLVRSLNKKLNKEMLRLWHKSYTQYFDSLKRG